MDKISRRKNRVLVCICMICCVMSFSNCIADEIKQIYAEKVSFKIQVNNEKQKIGRDILVVEGVSYVPLREFSNMFNNSVKWDEATQQISIISDFDYTLTLLKFCDETTQKYGYKDLKGNVVIDAQYDDASDFSEGAAIVLKDNEYTFINQSGYELFKIDADYHRISLKEGFSEGCCAVSVYEYKVDEAIGENFPREIIYLDKVGNKVIDKAFKEYSKNFHEGYAVSLKNNAYYFTPIKPILSYIDKSGNFATDMEYSEAGDFIDGYAKVITTDGVSGKIDRSFIFYPDI